METQQERSAIEQSIFSFSDAFNATDIPKIVASFTPDGINMPNNAPAAQGVEQLTKAFGFLFSMAKINIEYTVDEIVLNGDYAFARTHSIVNTAVKANGEQFLLENKEVFLFRNQNGAWRISHYIFNNTKTGK